MTLMMHRAGAAVLVVLALVFATIGGTVILGTLGGATARAEELSVEQFCALARAYARERASAPPAAV